MKNHPGDYNNKVGYDTYLNPWWGLETVQYSHPLVDALNEVLGVPDLWFTGCLHELLWGPRDLPRNWRPAFYCNLSGPQGFIYRTFWLPWRLSDLEQNSPLGANVDDEDTVVGDIVYVERYEKAIPQLREWLKSGVAISRKKGELAMSENY